jgi:hypothetical protein
VNDSNASYEAYAPQNSALRTTSAHEYESDNGSVSSICGGPLYDPNTITVQKENQPSGEWQLPPVGMHADLGGEMPCPNQSGTFDELPMPEGPLNG